MYSNLIYLILVMLTISFSSGSSMTPIFYFGKLTISLSALLLTGLIVLQNRLGKIYLFPNKKPFFLHLAQIEILIFLFLINFLFLASDIYLKSLFPQFLQAVGNLIFYFWALGAFYLSSSSFRTPYSKKTYFLSLLEPLRLLIPFSIPFLLFTLLADLYVKMPLDSLFSLLHIGEFGEVILIIFGAAAFFLIVMLFYPYFIQKAWGCKNIQPSKLKDRLYELSDRAHFKHAGMKTWPAMRSSITAAIIGIYSKCRYVVFTESLLKNLNEDEIEAVLGHEIAHSKCGHLLFYPFLLLGIGILYTLFSLIFGETLSIFLQKTMNIDWAYLELILSFLIYAAITALYFRLIFGLYSRHFERQADLYIFKLGIPPQSLISAFDKIAMLTGMSYDEPNWHHYSLKQRINFIKAASNDYSLISKHDQKVAYFKWGYTALLVCMFILLY